MPPHPTPPQPINIDYGPGFNHAIITVGWMFITSPGFWLVMAIIWFSYYAKRKRWI